jgi:hypothetical protein
VIGYCDTHGYVFTYSSTPWTADANGEIFPSRFLAYHLSDDGTTWESNNGSVHYITPVWTNTDILNTDGTLHLSASEPIPVYNAEPVAYLYNGVRLPDINTVWTDKEKYPYAVIYRDNYGDHLVLAGSCSAWGSNGFRFFPPKGGQNADGPVYEYNVNVQGDAWELFSTFYWITFYPVWTGTDIFNEDGSVYLSASEPIPVYE